MLAKVLYDNCDAPEMRVILNFLDWQGCGVEVHLGPEYLRESRGHLRPVIHLEGEVLVGFTGLYRHFESRGLFRT